MRGMSGWFLDGSWLFEKRNQILIIVPRNLNYYYDENYPNYFSNLVSKIQTRFDKQINDLHL